MTYLDIVAQVLNANRSPEAYASLRKTAAAMAPHLFKQCPKQHEQHWRYYFLTLVRFSRSLPASVMTLIIEQHNKAN